jgi:hypothetical protein
MGGLDSGKRFRLAALRYLVNPPRLGRLKPLNEMQLIDSAMVVADRVEFAQHSLVSCCFSTATIYFCSQF